jgi:uncharacterized phage protein (TIGR02220 family)
MSEARYIHIHNWTKYQHHKNRHVPWIKDYGAQMSDDDWRDLTFHQRGLLESLRLEYLRTQGRGIRDTTATLTRRLGQRVLTRDLKALSDAGFIEISSRQDLEPVYSRIEQRRETPFMSPLDWADDPQPFPDEPKPLPLPKVDSAPFKEIFEHWKRVRDKPLCKLTKDRETKIRARLKDGYSVEDLKTAIDGVAKDDWDQRPLHDDFGVIFRNSQYVDKFIALARNGNGSTNGSVPTTAAERYALEVQA